MSGFEPQHGRPVDLGNAITRVTASNTGAFTGAGTNTYLIGTDRLMIVDPGPDDAAHVAAVTAAVGGREVSHILVTHSHLDHIGAVAATKRAVGGTVVAEGPHRLSRPLHEGEDHPFATSGDRGFAIDAQVADNDIIDNGEVRVRAIATPGHAANHLVYEVGDECFSGDHVMGWSTTVVAPPDGSMRAYMASLERMLRESHSRYLPGHGDIILEPAKAVSGLRGHRLMRERAILQRLVEGDRTVADIVVALYASIDSSLHRAAGMAVMAHLEKLAEEGRVASDGFGRDASWWPKGE